MDRAWEMLGMVGERCGRTESYRALGIPVGARRVAEVVASAHELFSLFEHDHLFPLLSLFSGGRLVARYGCLQRQECPFI